MMMSRVGVLCYMHILTALFSGLASSESLTYAETAAEESTSEGCCFAIGYGSMMLPCCLSTLQCGKNGENQPDNHNNVKLV